MTKGFSINMSHKKGGKSFWVNLFHLTAATATAAPTPSWEEAWKAKASMEEAKASMEAAEESAWEGVCLHTCRQWTRCKQ
jgi:hypothetical protein